MNATQNPVDGLLGAIWEELSHDRPPLPWRKLDASCDLLRPRSLGILAGSPGASKSFMALELIRAAEAYGVPATYLPLENGRAFHARRLIGVLDRSWDGLADPARIPDALDRIKAATERQRDRLEQMLHSIARNPQEIGERPTPDFLLDYTRRAFESGRKLIIIDPLSMVAFPETRNPMGPMESFVQTLRGEAERADACALLVCHLIKRPEARELSLSDIQGGAMLSRVSDNVLLLASHDVTDREVLPYAGGRCMVESDRTVIVAKSRSGCGTGSRLAFKFGAAGPTFEEQGLIIPKRSGR